MIHKKFSAIVTIVFSPLYLISPIMCIFFNHYIAKKTVKKQLKLQHFVQPYTYSDFHYAFIIDEPTGRIGLHLTSDPSRFLVFPTKEITDISIKTTPWPLNGQIHSISLACTGDNRKMAFCTYSVYRNGLPLESETIQNALADANDILARIERAKKNCG